jgi:mannose-1-phosphate guanylyltransferase
MFHSLSLRIAHAPQILPNGDAIISLEKDVLIPLAGKHGMCLYETTDFFIQIKHARYMPTFPRHCAAPVEFIFCSLVTRFNEVLLQQYRKTSLQLLAKSGDGNSAPLIVGDVYIHPTATVHPTAKVVRTIVYCTSYVRQPDLRSLARM